MPGSWVRGLKQKRVYPPNGSQPKQSPGIPVRFSSPIRTGGSVAGASRRLSTSWVHAQLRENQGGEVHGAAADDAHEAAGETGSGEDRTPTTPARSHTGAGRLPALGRDGSRPVLGRALERPGVKGVPRCHRLDLVSHPAAAQSAPPRHVDPDATPDLSMVADPAHLPSVPARALRRRDPRWEPDAVVPLVRICGGGVSREAALLRQQPDNPLRSTRG